MIKQSDCTCKFANGGAACCSNFLGV